MSRKKAQTETLPLGDEAPVIEHAPSNNLPARSSGETAPVLANQSATSDAMQMMQVVREIALDPKVDVEKMKAVIALQKDLMATTAKMRFDEAFAKMQGELPVVQKSGKITITEKNNPKNVIQQTKYAQWDEINEAIRPILSKYGFALSFRTETIQGVGLKIVGKLSAFGHDETSEFTFPADTTGSKNNVQGYGSSNSYGKRYTACNLLNITTRDGAERDDDGIAADDDFDDGIEKVSQKQADDIRELCEAVGMDVRKLFQKYRVRSIEKIHAKDFDEIINRIRVWGEKAREAADQGDGR